MNLRDFFVGGHIRRFFPHLQRRLDLANAYQRVFAGPEGQIVLRDILHFAGVMQLDTELTGADALYRCGRRAGGMHILGRLAWSEGELMKLNQEITHDQLLALEQEQGA